MREATQFATANPGTLSVAMGRSGDGKDVTSPFTMRDPAAPNNFWFERPGPPQLTAISLELCCAALSLEPLARTYERPAAISATAANASAR